MNDAGSQSCRNRLTNPGLCCFTIILVLLSVAVSAADPKKRTVDDEPVDRLAPMVVTATRTELAAEQYPGRISVLDQETIEIQPSLKVDDLLRRVPGVIVQRNSSSDMRPVVGMRGLGSFEQGRVLVLMDGVPINKTDNGDVNWNGLSTEQFQRIEVLHGPGSAMYGSHAMGGVINLISRRPKAGLHGSGTLEAGSNDMWGNRVRIGGARDDAQGWWFDLAGHYLDTNGHQAMSDYSRASLDYPAEAETTHYLTEWSVTPRFGYSWNAHNSLDFTYRHYDDLRSEGRRGDDDSSGEYREFDTDWYQARLQGGDDELSWEANAFYQLEEYYKLYDRPRPRPNTDVTSDRRDYGLLSHISWAPSASHLLVVGIDYKHGSVEAQDIDEPGPGYIKNEGDIRSSGVYLQDTWFADPKLEINTGIRWDYVEFYDGEMTSDPSHLFAGYIEDNPIRDRDWDAWSPRVSARYHFTSDVSSYLSYARGFRAPELDDLCRTGWQYVGPKIANPELDPEIIDTIEWGGDWQISPASAVGGAVFYSRGRDFLYYVDTGIPVAGGGYWATRNYQIKQNVGEVEIYGLELDWRQTVYENLDVYANYSFTRTEIRDYDLPPFAAAMDLEGKELRNSPRHTGNLGVTVRHPWVNANLNVTVKGKYYTDDINSEAYQTNPYALVDLKFWRDLGENSTVSCSVFNLLDDDDTDTATGDDLVNGIAYDLNSHNPGREYRVAVKYTF